MRGYPPGGKGMPGPLARSIFNPKGERKMKRLMTLLLAAGLVLGATSAVKAADFKMSGLMQHRVSFADRNFAKGNGDDKMRAASRIRTQIDVIASESLKGVVFFEIGHQNWGKSAEGASLGTDGKQVKVRYSYVDWAIPQTDAKVRMGLQKYTLPRSSTPTARASTSPTSLPKTWPRACSGCAPRTTTILTWRSMTPTTRWTSSA